jgi:H+-translocating NAD(P) transhydrogenase subunit alpha
MAFVIGVPRATASGERRVALVPEAVQRLGQKGYSIVVEQGAGEASYYSDDSYREAGAQVLDRASVLKADLLALVDAPDEADLPLLASGSTLIGFLRPLDDPHGVAQLAERGVTAIAMEMVPRITRAQKMDALSAMATIAGYKAVLYAADTLPKFFPLLATAAGTIRPAKVLVLGAGVAGLQAIATARRLGAVVSSYDVRAAAAEQVRSLGARFVELELETADAEDRGGYAKALAEEQQRRQLELLAPHIGEADVVVTTALIPGRPAPLLITQDAVERMAPGSVIADIAAPNGGNCALTRPGEVVEHGGVRIWAPLNLPSELPLHASQMYARTVTAMIDEFTTEGRFQPAADDEIFQGACVARGGEVVNERIRAQLAATPA